MTLNSLRVQKGLQDNQLQVLTIGEKRIKNHRCLEGIIVVMYFTDKYLSYYSERLAEYISKDTHTHTHTHTHTALGYSYNCPWHNQIHIYSFSFWEICGQLPTFIQHGQTLPTQSISLLFLPSL